MKISMLKPTALALALIATPLASYADTARDIVVKGLNAVFIDKDVAAIETYFDESYIQHNPMFPNGLDTLRGFATNIPDGFGYQIGNVIADEEQGLVAVHFRVVGFGPKPMIGVDILRVSNGKIVEHWDVLQDEVTETASGNPMWTPAE